MGCWAGQLPLLLLWLLLLRFVASAQGEVKRAQPWMYERLFAASDKSLLKRAIEEDENGRAAVRTLQNYYEDMDRTMRATLREDDYDTMEDDNIDKFLIFYGWPELNEKQQTVFEPIKPRSKKDRVRYVNDRRRFLASEKPAFKALIDLGHALDSPTAARSVKSFISSRRGHVLQWKHVFHSNRANYTTEEETHNCIILANLALRIHGKWYVGASVTNHQPTPNLREKQRIYLTEYFRFGNSNQTAPLQVLPYVFDLNYKPELKYWGNRPYNTGPNNTFVGTPASTMASEFGGPAGVFFFTTRELKYNIAVHAALQDSGTLTRQVLDSKLWSNIAILLFPLFLSLVPLALFADVSDSVLLGYMVFTDFLSALPLAIKGGELIIAGTKEYFSTRTLLRGAPERVDSTLVASTWSCKCDATGNPTGYGISFVVMAIASVIIGVSLELIVKAKVEANNRIMERKFAVLNSEAEYGWERSTQCNECECYSRSALVSHSGSLPSIGGGLIGQIQQRRKERKRRAQ